MCNSIKVKYDIVIKDHFKQRYVERINNKYIYNNILNIIKNALSQNDINLIKILIRIYLNWKNNKVNFINEGKCIILYKYKNILYKISCKINILYNNIFNKYNIKIIFTTFMNVFENDINQISLLNNLIKLCCENKMFITNANDTIYFLQDYF